MIKMVLFDNANGTNPMNIEVDPTLSHDGARDDFELLVERQCPL
jgi:hypothetical protein